MDEDLDRMSHDGLIEEARRLRHGIRAHRDSSLHELCWHHPALWGLLPEKSCPNGRNFSRGASATAGRSTSRRAMHPGRGNPIRTSGASLFPSCPRRGATKWRGGGRIGRYRV